MPSHFHIEKVAYSGKTEGEGFLTTPDAFGVLLVGCSGPGAVASGSDD